MSAVAGLRVDGITVHYGQMPAVTDASLAVAAGTVLAVVGESGSGKTSLALAIARLLPPGGVLAAGSVLIGDVDVASLAGDELRRSRGRLVGYIAQDAMAALNPVMRAGRQIAEVFEFHDGVPRREADEQAVELLRQTGIRDPGRVARAYPHELSGGMRQRVMIAIAIALRPAVLVADEPTTALDATVQAEILALVRELQRTHGVTLVWITHDMGVVAELADDIAVMYGGRVVERGTAADVFARPAHPYTQALIATIGDGRAPARSRFEAIAGSPPHGAPPAGCPFHPRCRAAFDPCATAVPQTYVVGPSHESSCHLHGARA